MVDILQAEGISRYYHVAWADDSNGLNFSLTEYDGALMIGTYNDDSATESTDPDDYTWQIIGVAESGDGDPATAAAENEINALTAAVDDLAAKTITNAGNIDRANASSVEGIGQPNLLTGTNRGADGWTGSGFTLAAETGTVYNETDTPITWLKATCVTPGALSFTADGFRAILAEDSDTDTYTLSFDMRQSVLFDVNVSMSDADGTNTQIDFGTADSESDILEDLRDMAGTWTHQALTAQIVDGNTESAQVLLFDCSAMTAGDTIEIANLKIEGGAIATPWKASAEEAMNAANEALSIAGNTNQYFWHTETGTDTGAHITEIPKDDFIRETQIDPTRGGGNLLARSNGIAVRDGLTELATFGASGAQIGVTSGQHLSLTASVPFRSYNASGNLIGQIGNDGRLQFGAGTNASGTESVAIGKNATALGADAVALGWGANAYGEGSRSLGLYTDAHAASQTVLGMWNEQKYIDDEERRDDDIAFIFGNGYYGAPSNAVEMDWCGNIVVGSSNGGQNIRNTLLLGVGLEKAAAGNGQLVIGTYNIKKTKPLIIGNGTSSTRANVFEVDWSGNLEAAGDITDGNGNVLSNKIDAATLVDYVTEQASSGDWRYRKWHSGKIEAWYEGTFSTAASTTARGSLYYSTWTLTIPSAIGFTATPNTLIGNTGDSNTVIAVNGAATSKTAISGKVWRYASSSSALTISSKIYAWQD